MRLPESILQSLSDSRKSAAAVVALEVLDVLQNERGRTV
jgi:hypothetical protein